MSIKSIYVRGYRSLLRVFMRLGRINVLVGPNGTGKTNLYRSLYLIAQAAQGQLARALAEEGGMPSALWAGPRHKGPVRMSLEVLLDDFTYQLVFGLPATGGEFTAFTLDPEIKEENIWYHKGKQKIPILKRNKVIRVRDGDGNWISFKEGFIPSESALSEIREPERFPILTMLRAELLDWRFYHQFRTDPDSPLRKVQAGVRTMLLCHDGRDLAAALQTIREDGDAEALNTAFELAFPGASLFLGNAGYFSIGLQQPGLERALKARELSDGTLQYLCMLAVFLSLRPPPFLAINEPETSLHENLLDPLARLIVQASEHSQLWITTHSEKLGQLIHKYSGAKPMQVELVNGETHVINDDE